MIGMPIRAVRRKRNHHLRLDSTDMRGNLFDDLTRLGLIHIAVDVIQKADFMQTKMLCGTIQLCFTDPCHLLEAWIWSLVIEPASFPMRRAHKIRFDTLCGIARQCGAKPKCFIIGMWKDSQ